MKDLKKRRISGGNGLFAGALITMFSLVGLGSAIADGWLPGSEAPNAPNAIEGGISQTRHNLTMSYSNAQGVMGPLRNNYYEVCVYCHTPHGANSTAAAPLWNRTVTARTYTLYDNSNSLAGGAMSQPGPNSLTCLSCHDSVTAIDSIINMPTQLGGSFRAGYNKDQETGVSFEFLNAWGAPGNDLFERVDANGDPLLVEQPDPNTSSARPANGAGRGHSAFGNTGQNSAACASCHSPSQSGGAGLAPSFLPFLIGRGNGRTGVMDSDGLQALSTVSGSSYLNDDHPIGVRYPTEFGIGSGYNEPDHVTPRIAWFTRDDNNHADPDEIRLYDTGEGYEVECGSCHDPHGVQVSDADDQFIPSFLRVGATATSDPTTRIDLLGSQAQGISGNAGSKLCLTCHVK